MSIRSLLAGGRQIFAVRKDELWHLSHTVEQKQKEIDRLTRLVKEWQRYYSFGRPPIPPVSEWIDDE